MINAGVNAGLRKYRSIPYSINGRYKIAYANVPYAIHPTIKPQNINAMLPMSDPVPLRFKLFRNRYIKTPARSGWSKIRRLHASINGRIKKSKLNGEKTAD